MKLIDKSDGEKLSKMRGTKKTKIITRPFNEVFSQEEIDAVDKRILEAQEKERQRLDKAWSKVKDFPMNN